MPIPPEVSREIIDKVADIYRRPLEERFGKEGFVFDPIAVVPDVDHYGDPYLHVYIVFSGNQKKLDPEWTGGLTNRVRGEVDALGLGWENAPLKSFVSKSGWKRLFKRKYGQYESSRPD